MEKQKPRHKNQLALYRRRVRFSQKQVARLLGHNDTSMISHYERGRSLPPLLTALRLEIICRTPVAYLYGDLYRKMKDEIRTKEEDLVRPVQQDLFQKQ